MSCPARRHRSGFTLIELVVVVMILGILAAIAAPKLLRTSDTAIDNGLKQTLGVLRTAIDAYAAQHQGDLPGADGNEATFQSDIQPYLRGIQFPACPVGQAKNQHVRMLSGSGSITTGIGATAATQSWVYQYEVGDFFVNSTSTASDGATTYDKF
jgi:general secretion pathway protein G